MKSSNYHLVHILTVPILFSLILYNSNFSGEGDKNNNDELNGGEGKNKLKGGKGADTFICDVADAILDFKSAEGDNKIGECLVTDKSLPSLP